MMLRPTIGYLDAPQEVVTALRAIDPDADLVHLGGNEWLLGVRKPNDAARQKVEEQLKQLTTSRILLGDAAERAYTEAQMGKELQLLQFCASAPFRPIQLYHVGGGEGEVTFGEIVQDFRLRDFNWRTRPEAAFRELKEAVSTDIADARRTELVREKMRAEAGSMFRFVMKKARSILLRANPLHREA